VVLFIGLFWIEWKKRVVFYFMFDIVKLVSNEKGGLCWEDGTFGEGGEGWRG
jgi:hypothetical protein